MKIVFDTIQEAEAEAFRYKKRANRLRKRVAGLKAEKDRLRDALLIAQDTLITIARNRDEPAIHETSQQAQAQSWQKAWDTVTRLAQPALNAIAIALQPDNKQPSKCKWKMKDDEWSRWETECGDRFYLMEGDLKENGMKYCTYCGKEIDEVKE